MNENISENTTKNSVKKEKFKAHSLNLDIPLPALIIDLINKGIPVEIEKDKYKILGFYNLNEEGKLYIYEDNSKGNEILFTYDNRKRTIVVKTIDDLIRLNFNTWKNNVSKFPIPDTRWYDLINNANLIKIVPA